MAHKYHIITFGCQMNKSDSERTKTVLENIGMKKASQPEEADFILLNTCSVRQSAEDRVFGRVNNFQELKKNNPKLIIAVTGCMVGRDKKKEFLKKMPGVDLYFTIDELPQLPRMLHGLNPEIGSIDLVGDYLNIIPKYNNKFQAFVTIDTGCDKYCSYCVVPYARGPVRHRSVGNILKEINNLAKGGCVEVTLLGQTVNNYKAGDPDSFSKDNPFKDHFAALLWEVSQIEGIERVHWTAPHPVHMTGEVIEALGLPKQVNYLHLPVQSGSDKILEKMNRPYRAEEYLKIIEKVRKVRPQIALGTDIIVGFPGETERDFQDTVSLYRAAGFDISYTAMYSPRSGTAADRAFRDDVSQEAKKQRWQELESLMKQITFEKNQKYQNKTVSVLVEEFRNGKCQGHSSEMKLVEFASDEDLTGRIVDVIIKSPCTWILRGENK